MPVSPMAEVVQHLRRILLRDAGSSTDAQLLERFITHREESAVEHLLLRHGPMVWGVCRRILGNYHDAEDAFQATFLVLTRKAASISPRDMLGNWLHGVAYQTALNGRALAAKRKAREMQMPVLPEPAVSPEQTSELRGVIDDAVSRLPANYRAVIVLCGLEGRTRTEAAEQLGVPEGTIASRLARAKSLLAKRLVRGGVSLSATASAALLSEPAWSATVPAPLLASTVKAGLAFSAGQSMTTCGASAAVAALVNGGLTMMATKKLAVLAVIFLVLASMGSGIAYLAVGSDGRSPGGTGDSLVSTPMLKAKARESVEPEFPLADLPGLKFDGSYKVDPFIHAAMALQAMGKEKAGEKLFELSADAKRGNRVIVLCRMLFMKKKTQDEFHGAGTGWPVLLGGTSDSDWPLEPIELIDGVPFLITKEYQKVLYEKVWQDIGGPRKAWLKYCIEECAWNEVLFKTKDAKAKQAALDKLLASPKWKAPLGDEEKKFLADQIKAPETKPNKIDVRLLKFVPKDINQLNQIRGQNKLIPLADAAAVEKLLGKESAKGLIDQVDFDKEKIVLVSWATHITSEVGPIHFGVLKYEVKGEGKDRQLVFYIQRPPGDNPREETDWRAHADFFAVPKALAVTFDLKERRGVK